LHAIDRHTRAESAGPRRIAARCLSSTRRLRFHQRILWVRAVLRMAIPQSRNGVIHGQSQPVKASRPPLKEFCAFQIRLVFPAAQKPVKGEPPPLPQRFFHPPEYPHSAAPFIPNRNPNDSKLS